VSNEQYRGRLAPSPTGHLHIGHARTFWIAQQRARGGTLVLRNEDIDALRFKMEFVCSMTDDLKWFGLEWQEGPDIGGPFGPYNQSERYDFYRAALEKLRAGNFVYPCTCSRKDVRNAARAPHAPDDEVVYPGTCRNKSVRSEVSGVRSSPLDSPDTSHLAPKFNWRFRVPDDEIISFVDGHFGPQQFVAGKDFGDFVVWRQDDIPGYQLACVVDDDAMQITEVVRGSDLLLSTARQLLLYRALRLKTPEFFHCDLLRDDAGIRLAKRHDALSLRTLRDSGSTPDQIRRSWSLGAVY
jgi:glutamyl-tRNA synthetase